VFIKNDASFSPKQSRELPQVVKGKRSCVLNVKQKPVSVLDTRTVIASDLTNQFYLGGLGCH
jgi:hypothetical protein